MPLFPLLLAAAPAALAQDCPDRDARLDLADAAERALVEADLAEADRLLREIEATFSCGSLVEPELLGRMWLVEAAYLTLQGDDAAAQDSWRAADRVAPGRWVEDFGPRLRTSFEQAIAAPEARGTLALDPPLFRWIGAVDGRVVEFPAEVEAGLHLVQVGPDEDHVQFARVLLAFPNTPSVVVTGLIEPTSDRPQPVVVAPQPPVPAVPEREPVVQPLVTLHLGVGAGAVIGRPAEDPGGTEPGFKLTVPIETGAVGRPGGLWFRGAFSAAPLLGGDFLYEDQWGRAGSPASLGVHFAGGVAARQGDMGGLVAWQWPGRIALRGVLSGLVGRAPLHLEGRIGVNILSDGRSPEPAFDFVAAFTPRLKKRPEADAD